MDCLRQEDGEARMRALGLALTPPDTQHDRVIRVDVAPFTMNVRVVYGTPAREPREPDYPFTSGGWVPRFQFKQRSA